MDVFERALEEFLDRYEAAPELKRNDLVAACWNRGGIGLVDLLESDRLASLLFLYCDPGGDGLCSWRVRVAGCGCLTQVRSGTAEAYLPEATQHIRQDVRLHNSPGELADALKAADNREERRKILEPYAEQQRWLRRLFADYEEEQEAAALCCERFDLPLFEE